MALVKKKITKKVYGLVRDLTDKDKCPPQAKAIVGILKAAGKNIDREVIVAELKKPGVVTTTQSIERIWGFYRPRLIDMGLMREVATEVEVEVEVPDKPAAPPKAPAANAVGGPAKTAAAGQSVASKPASDQGKTKVA